MYDLVLLDDLRSLYISGQLNITVLKQCQKALESFVVDFHQKSGKLLWGVWLEIVVFAR